MTNTTKTNAVITDKHYNKGFNDGTRYGMNHARKVVAVEFVQRLGSLEEVRGIGPKTFEKIVDALSVEKPPEKAGSSR